MSEVKPALFAVPAPATQNQFPSPAQPEPIEEATQGPSPHAYRKALIFAALGAALGFLTGLGLVDEVSTENRARFAISALIAGLGAYVLFDPAMELFQKWRGGKREESETTRSAFAAVAIAAVAIGLSAFHEALGSWVETLGEHLNKLGEQEQLEPFWRGALSWLGNCLDKHPLHITIFAIIVMAGAFLAIGSITHYWVEGARQRPPSARLKGGIASLVVGILVSAALIALLKFFAGDWAASHHRAPLSVPTASLIVTFIICICWFLVPGVLGGAGIDRAPQRQSDPTVHAFWWLLAGSVGLSLLLALAVRIAPNAFPRFEDPWWIMLPIAALICQNLGWALALHQHAEFYGLRGESAEPGAEAEHGNAVAVMGDQRTPVERATDMVIRPRGDRLLATVALVLALIAGASAWYFGWAQPAPEIAYHVNHTLQQDSGLHDKNLSAEIDKDRVVTLKGVVQNEYQRQEALRRALSVRGVKQVIDEIQVQPQPAPAPVQVAPAPAGAPEMTNPATPEPAANANVEIPNQHASGAVAAPHKTSGAGNPQKSTAAKSTGTQNPVNSTTKPASTPSAKPGSQSKTPQNTSQQPQKHQNIFKKIEHATEDVLNGKSGPQKPTQNSAAPGATTQSSATENNETEATSEQQSQQKKKGLFHFLKKDKNKTNNSSTTSQSNSTEH